MSNVLKVRLISIEQQWQALHKQIFPIPLPPDSVQYIETRKAFYAGFTSAFHMSVHAASDYPEERVMRYFDDLQKEIEAFEKVLRAEVAQRDTKRN